MKLDGGGGIKFEILNKKKCKRIVPISLYIIFISYLNLFLNFNLVKLINISQYGRCSTRKLIKFYHISENSIYMHKPSYFKNYS